MSAGRASRSCDAIWTLADRVDLLVVEATFLEEDAALVDFAPRPPRQAGQQVKDPGDGSAAVELAEFLAGHKFI